MRPVRLQPGILAVVALLAIPCSTAAQPPTGTDAAIAELRQLLADQRAALDRQARTIEEQGRTLAALQQRVEGRPEVRRNDESCRTGDDDSGSCGRDSGSRVAAANEPHGCRARARSARDGRFGGRVPGFDPRSRDRVGLQARRAGANGRGAHAERPRDRGSVRHFLDSRGYHENGRGGTDGLLAHREPPEHRAPDAEPARADAHVHRKRLRRRRPDDEVAARVPPDQSIRRGPDMVHVFGSRGRYHRN